MPSGQGFIGQGTISDFVSCQGTISGTWSVSVGFLPTGVNLAGGVFVSGTANVNLYSGAFTADNSLSGISGGSLATATGYVGYSSTGTFTHTGGAVTLGSLYLGYNAGSSGTYNLAGPAVLSTTNEYLGAAGAGLFAQTDGLNSVGALFIGNHGRYQFSGGSLQVGGLFNQGVFDATNSAGVMTVVGSQIVDFSQSPPVNTGSMSLSVGPNSLIIWPPGFNPATAFGSYSNQGATHIAGTPLNIPPGQSYSSGFNLGDLLVCQGSFAATSGGSPNLNGGVFVSGSGNVNLGGGSFFADNSASGMSGGTLTSSYGYIGYAGTGAFTQSGGVHTESAGPFDGTLFLGYKPGSNGTYNLSGSGVLNTMSEYVGYSGFGVMNQSGGSNSTSFFGAFYVGYYSGSHGVYNLSGAGTCTIAWPNVLYLGNSAASSGAVNLSQSGLFTANSEYVGNSGSGAFTQTGGTNNGSSLTIAANPGSSGRYDLRGGVLATSSIAAGSGTAVLYFAGGSLLSATPLALSSSGMLLLTGTCTYSGTTTINHGLVMVNGSLAGPVTVNSGGILAGTGSLSNVTVGPGGQLAPGDDPGRLTLSGSLSLLSGAEMDYELGTPLNSDEIYMPTSLLALNGQQFSDFNFTWLGGFGPGTYDLIAFGSSSGSLGASTSGAIDGLPASLAVQGDNLVLNVVPEPGTLALVGTLAAALFTFRRRRIAQQIPCIDACHGRCAMREQGRVANFYNAGHIQRYRWAGDWR